MPMAATASMRMATHNEMRMAASGMYSSAMPRVAEAMANRNTPSAMIQNVLWPSLWSTEPIQDSMTPIFRMTTSASLMMSTKIMIPWTSAMARGTTVNSSHGASLDASSILA